ncbi:hypothetical protein G9A89_018463 [Geosiphon pyriformis]|nr:hypothetical protein G9A89_018463 [Geosiphon pyriformis]
MQDFLTTPQYNKFYIYKTPINQHQRFCNAFGYSRMTTVSPTIAVIKKVAKNSGADNGFRPVLSRKKRKCGVLAKNVLVGRGVIKTTDNHSQISEIGNTTESESINIEEKCLVKKTSIDYEERNIFDGEDSNQTPKSSGLKIKTKKVLDKSLGKINFEDGFNDSDFLDKSALLLFLLPLKPLVQVSVRKSFALDINLVAVAGKFSQKKLNFIKKIFQAIMAVVNLANEHSVVINTDLKRPGYNHMNRAIVLKKISVRTFIETVHTAVSEFGIIKLIKIQLVGLWQKTFSILIRKDAVHVARIDIDKQIWNSRNRSKALFYTLSVETNAHDLLAKIYEKKSAPIFCPLVFGGKTWASVADFSPLGGFLGYDSQLGSLRNGKSFPPVVNDLESHLVYIESSLVSLTEQISELVKRLESFVPTVSQPSPGCQLPVTSPSQNQGEDIVMEVGLSETTSEKTAAVSGSNASPEIVKLENMLEGLSTLVMSLSAYLNGLALASSAPSLSLSQ